MRQIWVGAALGAILALSACDQVRLPGDGRAPPADIPEGAPGPPPPATPVDDPYNEGDDDPVIPVDMSDPDTPEPETDTGEPETDDPEPEVTDPEIPPVESEPEPEPEPLPVKFQYYAPGELVPGSGTGNRTDTLYAPDMVFPIADAPAFPQSQVWRFGGGMSTGGQCDARNYEAPWQDNFCETRSSQKNSTLCPETRVHQGQDIRVGTRQGCIDMFNVRPAKPSLYKVVAVEDGIISYQGGYYLQQKGTATGNIYNYIHLNMSALQVAEGDTVTAGQHIGYVSDDFGGTPTTFHLHFEIKAPLEGQGITHVPPYMSLVKSYERREAGIGEVIEPDLVAVASIPQIPEGMEIIE